MYVARHPPQTPKSDLKEERVRVAAKPRQGRPVEMGGAEAEKERAKEMK